MKNNQTINKNCGIKAAISTKNYTAIAVIAM
jgi:hypothetical protein